MTYHRLVNINQPKEMKPHGIGLESADELKRVLIVNRGGLIYAFHGIDPLSGTPLNRDGNKCLDFEEQVFQRSLHEQVAIIPAAGPCPGQSLTKMGVTIHDCQPAIDF